MVKKQRMKEIPLLPIIVHAIEKAPQRRITFATFMELALYHPQWGYYQRERKKVGKDGDFYTSPFVGDIFGRVLADVMLDMQSQFITKSWGVVEFGGGDGRLAEQILDGLQEKGEIADTFLYAMIEKSPYHQQLQQHRLQGRKNLHWVTDLRDLPRDRPWIVLSNELIDAFPVHRVRMEREGLRELYVTWNRQNQCLQEVLGPLSTEELSSILKQEEIELQIGQIAEINVAARNWIYEVGRWLQKGFVLTIDYGYEAKELYRPERREGTLMCYSGHRAHNNPYRAPGEEDITSHINFSGLQLWGQEVGLIPLFFESQGTFLVRAGILQYLTETKSTDPFSPEARRNRGIRQLIYPGGMGDNFQVLIQAKGIANPQLRILNQPSWK